MRINSEQLERSRPSRFRLERVLALYYRAALVHHGLIFCVGYACHASVLYSLYRFLHFHMRTTVIHQARIVEASFALLQHVYPNLITSVPSMLYALS